MKDIKKILYAVAMVITMLCLPNNLKAQGNCLPDCDSVPFAWSQITRLQLPNGCWVKVVYSWRYACEEFDVSVTSIEPLTPHCNNYTLSQLISYTSAVLLKKNPMGFPLKPYDCRTIRVVKGACWSFSTNNCNNKIAKPCDTLACCVTKYRVCVDPNGNPSISFVGGSFQTKECDSNLIGCTSICNDDSLYIDSLGNDSLRILSPKHPMNKIYEIKKDKELLFLEAYPNPTKTKMTLEFEMLQEGHIVLSLYNNQGKEIVRLIDGDMTKGRKKHEIDLSKFPNGNYRYRLQTENEINGGTIVVQR